MTRKITKDLMSNKKRSSRGIRNQYLITNHHIPIISHIIFDRVQAMIPQKVLRITGEKKDMNPFNKKLSCGNCKLSFRKNHTPPWYYYKCTKSTLNQKLCKTPIIRDDVMVSMLLRAFREQFNTQDVKIIKTLQKILIKINQNDFFEFHRLKALTQIQMAKSLRNVKYTDEDIKQMQKDYKRFESKLAAIEDDRPYRLNSIKWLENIKSYDEFEEKATIDVMRAWILEMIIYSKEDYKIIWIDEKEIEIGNCSSILPQSEARLKLTHASGNFNVGNNHELDVITPIKIASKKGGDQNRKDEEKQKMLEASTIEPNRLVTYLRKQISHNVEIQSSLPVVRNEKLKVAAYVRVSTELEQQKTSLKAQYSYYLYLILKEPTYELAGIYVDDGKTGTTTEGRTEFNRMIEDCKKGKIDFIITKSLTRFARNTVDTLKFINLFDNLEPKVTILFERENLSSSDKRSSVLISILSAIGQQESMSLSESISWGKRSLAQRGVVRPAVLGYGFEYGVNKEWVVNEVSAKIVIRIYNEYLQGLTTAKIGNNLTKDNIPSPTGRNHWSQSTIDGILRSEIYQGNYIYQRYHNGSELIKKRIKNSGELPMYFIEDHHAAIIDSETWKKVQEKLQAREGNRKNRKKYPSDNKKNNAFSKKLICGECGSILGYARAVSNKNSKYIYYGWRCRQGRIGRCKGRSFDQEFLEKNFMHLVMDVKLDDDFQEHLKEYKHTLSIKPIEVDERILLENAKEELSQKLHQAVAKEIGQEGKNPKTVEMLIEKILKIREQLQAYIDREERLIAVEALVAMVLNRYAKADRVYKNDFGFYEDGPAFQADLFEQLVEKAVVYDDGKISYRLHSGLEWSPKIKYEAYQEKIQHQKKAKRIIDKEAYLESSEIKKLIEYCKTPKSIDELHQYFGKYSTNTLFKMKIIKPLMDKGIIQMTIPDIPRSKYQKFYSVNMI